MTTFMAINLGKDMRRQKKEKQALVNERNKLAIQKTEKAMKKLKEEKIELERGFEVGSRVQLITNITILTILTNLTIIIKVGLRGQARRIERLLRSLEVAENQADWLAREVRSKTVEKMSSEMKPAPPHKRLLNTDYTVANIYACKRI